MPSKQIISDIEWLVLCDCVHLNLSKNIYISQNSTQILCILLHNWVFMMILNKGPASSVIVHWSKNFQSACFLNLFKSRGFLLITISVSHQAFDCHTFHETVIRGNDAVFKCSIPSFVSDFVTVLGWVDSEGTNLGSQESLGNHPSSLWCFVSWIYSRCLFFVNFQWQVSILRLTYFVRLSLSAMMQYSNAQSRALSLTLFLLTHGSTLREMLWAVHTWVTLLISNLH